MEKNDDQGISDLGLDRDLRFSHRYQGLQQNQPYDDYDNKEEDNKDDNNDKGISALELDRHLGFSREYQGHQGHRPHHDDDKAEDDNKVKDNDKDDNDDKGI